MVDTFPEEPVLVWGVGIYQNLHVGSRGLWESNPAPVPDVLPCEDFGRLRQLA